MGLFWQSFLIDEYCYQKKTSEDIENQKEETKKQEKTTSKTGTKLTTKTPVIKTGIIPQVLDLLPKVNLTILKDKVCTSYR